MTFENQVENLCNGITKKTAEFWEDRNKHMLELTVRIKFNIYVSEFTCILYFHHSN